MNRENEHRPDMAEQNMGQQSPEDPKAKFAQMVENAKSESTGKGNYLPKKVLPDDMGGQREYNQIDHEEVLYHADLAKALQENFAKRVDELPQDIQVDLGVRRSQLEKKIVDFNKKWESGEQVDENTLNRAYEYQTVSKDLDALKQEESAFENDKAALNSDFRSGKLSPQEMAQKRDALIQRMNELPQRKKTLELKLEELQTDPELFEKNKKHNEKIAERTALQEQYGQRLQERTKTPKEQRPADPEGEAMYSRLSQLTNEVNEEAIPLQDLNRVKGPQYRKKFNLALEQIKKAK